MSVRILDRCVAPLHFCCFTAVTLRSWSPLHCADAYKHTRKLDRTTSASARSSPLYSCVCPQTGQVHLYLICFRFSSFDWSPVWRSTFWPRAFLVLLVCFVSLGDVGVCNVRLARFGLLWLSFFGRRCVVLFFVVWFLFVLSRVPLPCLCCLLLFTLVAWFCFVFLCSGFPRGLFSPCPFFLWYGRSRSKARSLHEKKLLLRKLLHGHRWSHAAWQIIKPKHKPPKTQGKTQISQPDLRLTIKRTAKQNSERGKSPTETTTKDLPRHSGKNPLCRNRLKNLQQTN